MGNHATLSLLGQHHAVPVEKYSKLSLYLRHLIIHGATLYLFLSGCRAECSADPPFTSLGYPGPTYGYHPFKDPDLTTLEAKVTNFSVWVTEYYKHPGYDSRELFNLDSRKHGDNASVEWFTAAERDEIIEKVPVNIVDLPLVFKMQIELGKQTQRALFDSELAQNVFPSLPITFLACKSTNSFCVYSFFETERRFKELEFRANSGRRIKFIELPDANHFVCITL